MKTFVYEYVQMRFGATVQPITLERAATLATNNGRARLVIAARDSDHAGAIGRAYNAAANAGTVAERFTVTFRGPRAAVAVISLLSEADQ